MEKTRKSEGKKITSLCQKKKKGKKERHCKLMIEQIIFFIVWLKMCVVSYFTENLHKGIDKI